MAAIDWIEDEIGVHFLRLAAPVSLTVSQPDYFQVLGVISGSVLCQADGHNWMVNTGEVLALGSCGEFSLQSRPCPLNEILILRFLPSMLGESGVTWASQRILFGKSETLALLLSVDREAKAKPQRPYLATKTRIAAIMRLLADPTEGGADAAARVTRTEQHLARMAPLFDFLDKHHAQPIRVEQAARLLHMSKSHFMRFFRTATGSPFVVYLNGLRISRAQQLLATTGADVATVGQEVGFGDQSYFCDVFRRTVGMAPSQYRNHLRSPPLPASANRPE